jgi:hypothetical protein
VGNKHLRAHYIWLAMLAFATLLATSYIRHQLIEPVAMGVYCETSSSWACTLRQFAILVLQERRLAWFALGLVGIAFLTRYFPIALLAWCIACAGLVLYSAELCSIALLLAGIVAIRAANAATQTGDVTQSQ